MSTNSRTARPAARYRELRWLHYEALPAGIRSALAESTLNWGPASILDCYRLIAVDRGDAAATASIVQMLRRSEVVEIAEWSNMHLEAYGYASPHVAAEASILRYDSHAG